MLKILMVWAMLTLVGLGWALWERDWGWALSQVEILVLLAMGMSWNYQLEIARSFR